MDSLDVARFTTRAPSGVFYVHRAFGLENDEQLVGAVRDQCGPPRHYECRAPTAHQDPSGRGIGAGGKGEACFLQGVRQRQRVEVCEAGAKRLPEPLAEIALRIAV